MSDQRCSQEKYVRLFKHLWWTLGPSQHNGIGAQPPSKGSRSSNPPCLHLQGNAQQRLSQVGAHVSAIHSSKNWLSKKRSSRSVLPVAGGACIGAAGFGAGGVAAALGAPKGIVRRSGSPAATYLQPYNT